MKRPFLNQEQRLQIRLETTIGANCILTLRFKQFIRSIYNIITKNK